MDIFAVSLHKINDGALWSFSHRIRGHVTLLIIEVDKVDTSGTSTVNLAQIDIKFQFTTKIVGLEGLVGHRIAIALLNEGMVIQTQSKLIARGLQICCFETLHVEFLSCSLVSIFSCALEHLETFDWIFSVA